MVILTSSSVINPDTVTEGIEQYQSDLFAYAAILVAVTAIGLFVRSLTK